jgi:hypothetical protein
MKLLVCRCTLFRWRGGILKHREQESFIYLRDGEVPARPSETTAKMATSNHRRVEKDDRWTDCD